MGFASRKRRSIEEELGEAADGSFAMVPLIRQRRQDAKRPAVRGAPKKAPMKKGPAKPGAGKKGPAKKGPAKGKTLQRGGKKGPAGKAGGKKGSAKKGPVQKYLQTCVENSLTNGESWND